MQITKRIDKQHYILKLSGTFTNEDCHTLNNALEESFRSFCKYVLMDMEDLLNITPSAQRILLSFLSQVQSLKITLILYNVNTPITTALQDSGIANFLHIASSLEEAKLIIGSKS